MCDVIVVVPVFRNKRIQNFNSSNHKAELKKIVSPDAISTKSWGGSRLIKKKKQWVLKCGLPLLFDDLMISSLFL